MKLLKTLFPFILIILALIAMLTRQQIGFFLFIGLLYIIFDLYTYNGFISLIPTQGTHYMWIILYLLVSAIGVYGFIYAFQHMRYDAVMRSPSANLLLGFSFSLFVGKLVFASLMSFQDVSRLLIGIGQYIMDIFSSHNNTDATFMPSRRKALTMLSAGLAAIPFAAMLYGITRGKYQFSVTNNVLRFPDLPPEFDGFKIVQISDVHSGSWDDLAEVARGIEMIQEQAADIIVFTGDLVNTHKDEINPFIEIFARLSAPYGKYACLGNHDYYGDRIVDKEERSSYWADFYKKFEQMGFELLNNSNRYIQKGEDKISLVGVENWGAGRWFPKKGDLDKALEGTNDGDFTVLLSHDPTHWDEHVIKHKKHIHLTLSGHTHGMQFGINLPGFQWSPVKYRYKKWMGMYEQAKQYLYVNRGFGYLAFPGRVGMWPEISVFELKRG